MEELTAGWGEGRGEEGGEGQAGCCGWGGKGVGVGLEGEDSQGPERGRRESSDGEARSEEMGTSDSVSADMCM